MTPVVLLVVLVYVGRFITFAHREPYALGLTARAMNVLGLVAPVFAATAAWEGARLRRAGLLELPRSRSLAAVVADALWPCIAGSAIVVIGAAVEVLLHERMFIPDAMVVVLALGLVTGLSALGFAMGVVLPRGLAVSLAAFGAFLWFVVPRVAGSAAIDHATGTSLELCCATSRVLRDGVIVGIGVVAVALAVGSGVALVVAGGGRPAVALGAAAVPVAIGLAVGGALAGDRMTPTDERPGRGTACATRGTVRACVWPEHASDLSVVADGIEVAVSRWARAGVRLPAAFLEGQGAGWPQDVPLRVFAHQSAADYTAAAADAMVGEPPTCDDGRPAPSAGAQPYLWVWLARTAGIAETVVADRWEGAMRPDPEEYPTTPVADLVPVLPLVDRVMRLPPALQGAWVNANIDAMRACGITAPLQP